MKNLQLLLLAIVTFTMLQFKTLATNVSGGIYVNTTWTLANSPYIVTDTVVVFPGVTLTIQPGVVVKFNNNIYLEIRNANIIAKGTITDSITFTSNTGAPSSGIWQGVKINTSQTNSIIKKCVFNYCNFRYATYGLLGGADTLILKNSNFNYNTIGLYYGNGTFVVIDSNNFSNNSDCGWYRGGFYQNQAAHYCSFSNNNKGTSDSYHLTLINCSFRSNITAMDSPDGGNIFSSIINNNQKGIDYLGGNNVTIKNCTIDSNSVVGVHLYGNDSLINCHLDYNGTAIISQNNQNTIVMCTIENNGIGINLTGYNANIYCNKICNNTNYGFSYTNSTNISFPNNYWCTTDSTIISATVHDGYDNVIYGLVNFMPLDTVSCYLTGCNLHITTTVTNATCANCTNGSAAATIINGRPPYTYTWYSSPLQNTQTATGLHAGWYTICVSDANGCSACDSVFIDSTNCTGYSIATHTTNASCSTCHDGSAWVTHSGGTAPYNYTWYTSPIQTTDSIAMLLQGTYHVCVTDAHGCTVCDSAIVNTGNCSAHFNLYADTIPHNYIASNMASGVGPITYLWSWGDGTYDSTAYPNHTYATTGFYTICLTITDAVGCTNNYCPSYFLLSLESAMVHVNVVSSTTVGINNINKESIITIAPNPFSSSTVITFSEEQKNTTIRITDVLGNSILQSTINGKQYIIEKGDMKAGVYFVQITDDKKNAVNRKVIIQ